MRHVCEASGHMHSLPVRTGAKKATCLTAPCTCCLSEYDHAVRSAARRPACAYPVQMRESQLRIRPTPCACCPAVPSRRAARSRAPAGARPWHRRLRSSRLRRGTAMATGAPAAVCSGPRALPTRQLSDDVAVDVSRKQALGRGACMRALRKALARSPACLVMCSACCADTRSRTRGQTHACRGNAHQVVVADPNPKPTSLVGTASARARCRPASAGS